MHKRKAFTLMELLVVISIIALLMSILMPSLSKAKYMARKVVCMTSIKDQHTLQMTYAASNSGKFAEHNNLAPEWIHDGPWESDKTPEIELWNIMDPMIENPDIFECPLLKSATGGRWESSYLTNVDTPYGWAYKHQNPDAPEPVLSAYAWFANFKDNAGQIPEFRFTANFNGTSQVFRESPWPNKDSDCTSSKAFIAHRISWASGYFWDLSHDGIGHNLTANLQTYSENAKSQGTPVGYADGHIEYRDKREVVPRAIISGYNYFLY